MPLPRRPSIPRTGVGAYIGLNEKLGHSVPGQSPVHGQRPCWVRARQCVVPSVMGVQILWNLKKNESHTDGALWLKLCRLEILFIYYRNRTLSPWLLKKSKYMQFQRKQTKNCESLILLPKSWTVQAYFKSRGLGRRSTEILRPMIPSANLGGLGLTVSRNRPHWSLIVRNSKSEHSGVY